MNACGGSGSEGGIATSNGFPPPPPAAGTPIATKMRVFDASDVRRRRPMLTDGSAGYEAWLESNSSQESLHLRLSAFADTITPQFVDSFRASSSGPRPRSPTNSYSRTRYCCRSVRDPRSTHVMSFPGHRDLWTCAATRSELSPAARGRDVSPMWGCICRTCQQKEDAALPRPDEKYAPEVMQLFTIGLVVECRWHGEARFAPRADRNLLERRRNGLARVRTVGAGHLPPKDAHRLSNRGCSYPDRARIDGAVSPLHSASAKTFLAKTFPRAPVTESLKKARHCSVTRMSAVYRKQLIAQRHSNPSRILARVTRV